MVVNELRPRMMTSIQKEVNTAVCGANHELGGRLVIDKVKYPTIRIHTCQYAVQQDYVDTKNDLCLSKVRHL